MRAREGAGLDHHVVALCVISDRRFNASTDNAISARMRTTSNPIKPITNVRTMRKAPNSPGLRRAFMPKGLARPGLRPFSSKPRGPKPRLPKRSCRIPSWLSTDGGWAWGAFGFACPDICSGGRGGMRVAVLRPCISPITTPRVIRTRASAYRMRIRRGARGSSRLRISLAAILSSMSRV
jgi:hypothetical protein